MSYGKATPYFPVIDLLRRYCHVEESEDYSSLQQLIYLGHATRADLPDLLIGLAGKSRGCETTLTFEKGLTPTGLFEQL